MEDRQYPVHRYFYKELLRAKGWPHPRRLYAVTFTDDFSLGHLPYDKAYEKALDRVHHHRNGHLVPIGFALGHVANWNGTGRPQYPYRTYIGRIATAASHYKDLRRSMSKIGTEYAVNIGVEGLVPFPKGSRLLDPETYELTHAHNNTGVLFRVIGQHVAMRAASPRPPNAPLSDDIGHRTVLRLV